MTSPDVCSKILIFRLSALGDVILCSSALEALRRVRPAAQIHWLISTTWAPILDGDSRIERLIRFDRRAGFLAWHRLCRELFQEHYDDVLDLHSNLRTIYARAYFFFRGLVEGRSVKRWSVLSKSRWRRFGYFLFKSRWPRRLRPDFQGGIAARAAILAGGAADDRPNLSHLLNSGPSERVQRWIIALQSDSRGYLAVMPSSAWPGKRWSIVHFAEILQRLGMPVVILGTPKDAECLELHRLLEGSPLKMVRAFDGTDFPETAHLIRAARLLVSNDTGLVHLAESIGTSVVQLFGPTDPSLGFGAWRSDSRTVGASLWCRPCSKDGAACFRLGSSRFLCMQQLSSDQVIQAIEQVMVRNPKKPSSASGVQA